MMSKQLFLAAATLALVSAQKFHGREEIECEKEHAVMGVGGRCHCGKGFKMQRLEPNALGEHQECVPTSMFNPAPQCPIGHECGRECFDGLDMTATAPKIATTKIASLTRAPAANAPQRPTTAREPSASAP
jgi:hypothetical protein